MTKIDESRELFETVVSAMGYGCGKEDGQYVRHDVSLAWDVWQARAGHGAAVGAIDMVLHCPNCGLQHIDAPEPSLYGYKRVIEGWANPPHRSHLCHGCGHIWRPADVETNGVAAVKTKGKADMPIPQRVTAAQPSDDSRRGDAVAELLAGLKEAQLMLRVFGRQAISVTHYEEAVEKLNGIDALIAKADLYKAADETAWLIESNDDLPRYRTMDESGIHWTDDVNKAIRFARRDDAEMFCSGDEHWCHIREHMWCNKKQTEATSDAS